MKPTSLRHAAPAALVLSAAALAAADLPLTGRVVDRSGDPVPGAELRLVCDEAASLPFLADDNGRFLARLPEGASCILEARLAGDPGRLAAVPLAVDPGGAVEVRIDVDLFVERLEIVGSAPYAVGARELRESLAHDVGEALVRVAGVEKLRKGGLASDVVVRGQKGDNVAVRIDGQPLHGACPNRMDPATFHVDFAEVERVEVSKGPFDVASAGLAGTVAIESREPDPGFQFDLAAAFASAGYVAPAVTVSHGAARWSLKAGWAGRRGDPYEDGDGRAITALLPLSAPAAYRADRREARAFHVATGWAGASWTPRAGHRIDVSAARQEAATQLYPYLQMDALFDDMSRVRAAYRFQSESAALESFEASAGWSRVDHFMDDRNRVSGQSMVRPYSMATDADARDASLDAQAGLRSGWRLGLAAHRRGWDTRTLLAGRQYRPQASVPDARADSVALYASRRRALSATLDLELGARLESVASSADAALADTALYEAYHATRATEADDLLAGASAALLWRPRPEWELAARLGSAARPPDPQERWYGLRRMGTDWVGNPGLDPARNTQLELRSSLHAERLTLDVDLWGSRLDDAVTLVEARKQRDVPGVMNTRARSYVNHDARMWGAEATAMAPLGRSLALAGTLAWTRGSRDRDPGKGVVDPDLPEVPPLSARLALRYEPARWWAELEGVAAGRQGHVDSGVGESPTPGWALANLRGGVAIGRSQLVVGVENVFDRAYREHLSYYRDPFRAGVFVPEPGRTWTASWRYRYGSRKE